MTDMDKAKLLHKKLRSQLHDTIATSIVLLELIDEKPTLVQILGSITSELHDILRESK